MIQQLTSVAAILAAIFFVGCDTAPETTDPVDTTSTTDTSPKADDPNQVVDPIETTLEVSLEYAITDGDLQISIYPVGTSSTKVSWTTVTEGNTSFVIDVFVGDVYVVWLRYGDFSNSQTIHVDAEDKTFVVNVNSALHCAQYEDIAHYAWTCEGTNIESDTDFYVVEKDGHCFLQEHGWEYSSPEGSHWIYPGQGEMSINLCGHQDPNGCWRECTGTPLVE